VFCKKFNPQTTLARKMTASRIKNKKMFSQRATDERGAESIFQPWLARISMGVRFSTLRKTIK
jgi:hypothetical protein